MAQAISSVIVSPPLERQHCTIVNEITPEYVIAKLELAGATLLALKGRPGPAGLKVSWPDYVQSFAEAYGYSESRLRPTPPASVDEMDEILAWINLIPAQRYVLRRIVGARALVSPATQRHLFSWVRIGKVLGCDRRAVASWHKEGISLIVKALKCAEGAH